MESRRSERGRIQCRDIKSLGKWKWAADRLTVGSDSFRDAHPTASLVHGKAEIISRPTPLPRATE